MATVPALEATLETALDGYINGSITDAYTAKVTIMKLLAKRASSASRNASSHSYDTNALLELKRDIDAFIDSANAARNGNVRFLGVDDFR